MKLEKIAKITLFASIAVNIANIFTKVDLSQCGLLLLVCSLFCFWNDEQNLRLEDLEDKHKAIINRIIAETIVVQIETEIEGSKELWTQQELLEMIEKKKKNYEDLKK